MASAISPTVAFASTARTIGGTRLSDPRAAATTSIEAARHAVGVARRPNRPDALDLAAFDLGIDAQDLDAGGALRRERIDADDDGLAGVDLLLRAIRRLLNRPLDEALLDRRQRAAGRLDALEQRARAVFDLVGQRLDRVRAAERIDGVRRRRFPPR